jgi:hypothetical protein
MRQRCDEQAGGPGSPYHTEIYNYKFLTRKSSIISNQAKRRKEEKT